MTGYLADAKELHTTLSWYRDRTNGDMAAILRAGPPDSASTQQALEAKLAITSEPSPRTPEQRVEPGSR